jgi:murein DD-endopeptidase MepM/ murein hydrolase activator NlpD
LARRRRKRRSGELKSSFRLGFLLLGLVGVNIYVFFFNRHTAPREVLNLQSTSRTLEASRREALADDVRAAQELIAADHAPRATAPAKPASAAKPPAAAKAVPAAAAEPAPAAETAPAVPATGARPTLAANANPSALLASAAAPPAAAPVIRVPFAPPPEPSAPAPRGMASRPGVPRPIQIPFAPPPEDDTTAADAAPKAFAPSDTLGQVLAREGFGPAGPQVIAALAKLCDPRTIRGGQKYVVRTGDDGAPEVFEYQPSAALRYVVERHEDDGGNNVKWQARKLESAVEIKPTEAGGVVESSLYESVQKAGESSALVSLLVELLAWDVNFYTDTHPGDHWKVVVEKEYLGGQFYKYGHVLAAEYGGKVGTFRAFFWAGKDAPRDKPGKYYDERGQAVSKSMLKTPLRFVRISSKFDRKRFHPILHVEKAHLGIDYAAPTGTPVWASASGRVVEVGPMRGSGNTVILAHANGLSTRYYHLSKFARGLHAGQQVKQKDVIGYVGMTGLATGPHLHFSVTKNGAFVDPSKLAVNRDPPVPDMGNFMNAIRPRIAALKTIQPGAVARN